MYDEFKHGNMKFEYFQNLVHIFYRDKLNMMFLLWTGERDEWRLVLKGTLNDEKTQTKGKLNNFYCEASITFLDNYFRKGFACVAHKSNLSILSSSSTKNFQAVWTRMEITTLLLSASHYLDQSI